MCVYVLSHVQLGNLMEGSQPGSSVHGIFQARILERGALSSSMGSSRLRDLSQVSHIEVSSLLESPGKLIQYHIAHCASWAPSPQFVGLTNKLDLRTLSQNGICLYIGDLLLEKKKNLAGHSFQMAAQVKARLVFQTQLQANDHQIPN